MQIGEGGEELRAEIAEQAEVLKDLREPMQAYDLGDRLDSALSATWIRDAWEKTLSRPRNG